MIKFYDSIKTQSGADKIYCTHCGAANLPSATVCESCETALLRPAPFAINFLEATLQPKRAISRIVATVPFQQALLTVLLMIAVYLLITSYATLINGQTLLDNLDKISEEGRKEILSTPPPIPDLAVILINFGLLIFSWLFLSAAIYYTVRLIHRDKTQLSYTSVIVLVGFARVAVFSNLILLLPIPINTSYAIQPNVQLIWRVVLIGFGIKSITNLTWTQSLFVVLIPVLLYQFLRLPV